MCSVQVAGTTSGYLDLTCLVDHHQALEITHMAEDIQGMLLNFVLCPVWRETEAKRSAKSCRGWL